MKKLVMLPVVVAFIIGLCACAADYESAGINGSEQPLGVSDTPGQENYEEDLLVYTDGEKLTCPSGDTYVFLANEGFAYTFGEGELFAVVAGEDEMDCYNLSRCGLYEVPNDADRNVVRRVRPDNEWFAIYVKEDYDVVEPVLENISRLVYTEEDPCFDTELNSIAYGTDGLTGEDAQLFLNDVQKADSPETAGYYDYVLKDDGSFENCYGCGYLLGFFGEERAYFAQFSVTSYDDKGFSLQLGEHEYALTEDQVKLLGIIE